MFPDLDFGLILTRPVFTVSLFRMFSPFSRQVEASLLCQSYFNGGSSVKRRDRNIIDNLFSISLSSCISVTCPNSDLKVFALYLFVLWLHVIERRTVLLYMSEFFFFFFWDEGGWGVRERNDRALETRRGAVPFFLFSISNRKKKKENCYQSYKYREKRQKV